MTVLFKVVQAENELAAKMPDAITVAVFYLEEMAHNYANQTNRDFWFVVPFNADYKKWLNIEASLER